MRFLQQFLNRTQPLADNDTFARFYEDTHINTYRYVMALCGGHERQAEDITADAYLRAWKNRQRFSGSPDAAFGWVLTIARHLLIDECRAKTAHLSDEALNEDLADRSPGAEAELLDEELKSQLIAALQALPENQREMLVLRYILGWRVNRIAAHLNLPDNTVSVTIGRSLKRLQDLMVSQGVAL